MKPRESNAAPRLTSGSRCSEPIPGAGGHACPMVRCRQAAGRMALGMLGFVLLALLGAGGLWVGYSHFEARSFERVTGTQVSTWDAMFLELRVQQARE